MLRCMPFCLFLHAFLVTCIQRQVADLRHYISLSGISPFHSLNQSSCCKANSVELIYLLVLSALTFLLTFCREDDLTTNPSDKLSFSADTLGFDTVFTTVGSTTQGFLIFNSHKNRINISSARLAGGSSSPFRMNIDGMSGKELSNINVWGRRQYLCLCRSNR